MPENLLDRLPTGARVAIVRLRSLGDCVLTTPAIDLLKRARPDLQIAVVVEDRFRAVFEKNPSIAAILSPSYAAIARWHPQLCINFHGGTRSMLLSLTSMARWRAGFAHHSGAGLAYNIKIPRAQEILGEERIVHTAEHLASAMFYLGVPRTDIPRAILYAETRLAAKPYAVIHPVSAAAYKTWHAEGFLASAEYLASEAALEPIFIGAAGDDLSPFSKHRIVQGAALAEVKSLLAGASLFVGNDSGPAHIAAAFGIPVIVLYGRREHQQIWAPWKTTAAKTFASPDGISAIAVDDVLAAIAELNPQRA